MDELEISGKRFISSKRAAKENRYHVDYIGQLIRSGKVIGSKVGRTWYVDARSLATYLGKEYKDPERPVLPTFAPAQTTPTARPPYNHAQHAYTPEPILVQEAPKLTYITEDEAPVLQVHKEIRKVEAHIPEKKAQVEEQNVWDELEQPLISRSLPAKSPKWALVAVAGVLAFLGALGGSALFSYSNIVAGEENTAAVTFTGIQVGR
jgi:hypothetical protein